MYMVTSGKHFNNRCCFDYGNAEANAGDDGDGTMEAIYFGNDIGWNREHPANLTGPWRVCAPPPPNAAFNLMAGKSRSWGVRARGKAPHDRGTCLGAV